MAQRSARPAQRVAVYPRPAEGTRSLRRLLAARARGSSTMRAHSSLTLRRGKRRRDEIPASIDRRGGRNPGALTGTGGHAPARRASPHPICATRYARLLIAQRAHPKCIQAQPGHASSQTTLDRYRHLMPDAHVAEARRVGRLVFGDGVTESRSATGRSPDATRRATVLARVTPRAGVRMGPGTTKGLASVLANPHFTVVAGAGFEPATFGL